MQTGSALEEEDQEYRAATDVFRDECDNDMGCDDGTSIEVALFLNNIRPDIWGILFIYLMHSVYYLYLYICPVYCGSHWIVGGTFSHQ